VSTGVVLSALLIIFTGWVSVDPIVTADELDRRFGIKHATLQIEGGEEASKRGSHACEMHRQLKLLSE
jgi:Co/Zn/Cd efflux system component